MFCHNCGFKTKDQKLTKCPECSCCLSFGLSSGSNQGKEEIFQDIENILNNAELSELNESTDVAEDPEKEDPFDLDFETVNQDEQKTTEEIVEDNDETGDEIEPKKASKYTFLLFFIFSLIIAAGAGVLYLKTKQPASPAFPKENASIYENKKSFVIKNDKIQPAVNKPDAEKTSKAPKQPSIKKTSLASKKSVVVSSTAKPQENKTSEKIIKKNNSWTTYIPGKQAYYTIQISSLSNRSFARANLNILKSKEYPAYVLLTRNKESKTIYKLRIGKYETAKKAKKTAEVFYKKEKMKYIILKSTAEIDL